MLEGEYPSEPVRATVSSGVIQPPRFSCWMPVARILPWPVSVIAGGDGPVSVKFCAEQALAS